MPRTHPAYDEVLVKVKAIITGKARKLVKPEDLERIAWLCAILKQLDKVSPRGAGEATARRKWARGTLDRARKMIETDQGSVTVFGEPVELWHADVWTAVQGVLHEFEMHLRRVPLDQLQERKQLVNGFTEVLAVYAPRRPVSVAEVTDYLERLFLLRWEERNSGKVVLDEQMTVNEVVILAEKLMHLGWQGLSFDPLRALKRNAKRRGKD